MALPALPGLSGSDKVAADRANGVIEGTLTAIGPSKAFAAYGPLNLVVYGVLADALTTTAGTNAGAFASATGLAVGQSVNSANVRPGATIKTLVAADATFAFMPEYWAGVLTPNAAQIVLTAPPELLDIETLNGATIVSPYFATGVTVTGVNATTRTLTTSADPTSVPAVYGAPLFEFRPDGSAVTETGADATATVTGAGIVFNCDFQIERSFDGGATWIVCNIGGSGALAQYTSDTPLSMSFGDPEQLVLYRLNATAYTGVANVTVHYRISTTGQASTTLSVPAIS